MKVLDVSPLVPQALAQEQRSVGFSEDAGAAPNVSVLLSEDRCTVRRIALAEGAGVPPCSMRDDVVFVVLEGRVVFSIGDDLDDDDSRVTTQVDAPGAVFIPGGAATRSMRALAPSLMIAVLCRATETDDVSASWKPSP